MRCVILALLAVVAVSADFNPFAGIPECERLKASGYGVTGCSDDLSECFKEAHSKAQKCVIKEISDPKVKECGAKPEIKELRKQWFNLSCKWHNGVKKCMAGESIGDFTTSNMFFRFKRDTGAHGHKYEGKHPECWREAHAKAAECSTMAGSCEGYKVCAGEEEADDQRRRDWYEAVNDLKQQKHEKMQSFKQKLSACIRESEAQADQESQWDRMEEPQADQQPDDESSEEKE